MHEKFKQTFPFRFGVGGGIIFFKTNFRIRQDLGSICFWGCNSRYLFPESISGDSLSLGFSSYSERSLGRASSRSFTRIYKEPKMYQQMDHWLFKLFWAENFFFIWKFFQWNSSVVKDSNFLICLLFDRKETSFNYFYFLLNFL